ncbi:MAG: Xylose isomerase-like TIM barrel [Lentisphaerae bacterium ADurb.BinA184]|nr:MAG: Xylose isomerase-like TIM barrel [Lentisphaerae bacterium ADurb.BinA184]
MRYSMMSYTMARRPELFNLEAMLRLTRELDLAGIDFVTLHGRTADELRRIADDHGVPVIAYTFMAQGLTSPDAAERRQAVAAARANWIRGLREFMPPAGGDGPAVTVENFPGCNSPFVTAADFLEARREIPGLMLTYDNGNAASGEDPEESCRRCAPYIVHAHFKDWVVRDDAADGYTRMRDGRYYQPALIGEGVVPQARCLAALRAAGYTGCINIEYEGNLYPPAEAVRRAVATLRAL